MTDNWTEEQNLHMRMKRLERIIEHVAVILTKTDNTRAVHKRRNSPQHDMLALKRLSEFFCESSDVGDDIRKIISVFEEELRNAS